MPLLNSRGGLLKASRALNTDPYYANVALLLHCDGSNGSTTFIDQKGKVITANGDARITTTDPKFGTGALLLNGNGDYLSTPNTSDLNVNSTNDFAIETWIYKTTTGSGRAICGNINGAGGAGFYLTIESDETLLFGVSGGSPTILTPLVVPLNQWAYVALSKLGNNYTFAVNNSTYSVNNSTAWASSGSSIFSVGFSSFASFPLYFLGKIDEFRFTSAIARSLGTVPTAAFPNS